MIINRTPEFKRNYKKLKKKHYDMAQLRHVIELIINHQTKKLIQEHHDHQLKGQLREFRSAHIRKANDNWVLVYRIHEDKLEILDLIRTGNHDQAYH